MLGSKSILIADGSSYAAIDLCQAIEDSGGRAFGPIETVSEALAIVDCEAIAAAIVDCELDDAAALILRLAEKDMPLVVQTSVPLPTALEALDGRLSVLMRPVDPRTVIDTLLVEIGREGPVRPADNSLSQNKLGSIPKQV